MIPPFCSIEWLPMKRAGLFFFSALLALSLGGCEITPNSESQSSESSFVRDPNVVYVEEVILSKTELTLRPKQTYTLATKVSPSNADNTKVDYTTSDPEIVSVDRYGKLTAGKEGEALITVKAQDGAGAFATCRVKVETIQVEEIVPSETDVRLSPGASKTIHCEILPKDATDTFLSYFTDDEEVATFDNGVITAQKIGSTTGYVVANNGVEAQITITVAALPLSDVYFESTNLDLIVGESFTPSPVLVPSQGSYDGMVYTSSDSSVVTVDGLTLTAKAEGEATVTLSLQGKTSKMNVRVLPGNSIKRTVMKRTYQDYYDNNLYPIDSAPCEHEAAFLVIPIWFTDSGNYISDEGKETVRKDIETAFFGSQKDTGWNSVASFYHEESYGRFTLQGKVTDWMEVGRSSSAFSSPNEGGLATYRLVETAFDWAKQKYDLDPVDYDKNRDGYVDGVILIYGAPDYNAQSDTSLGNLWAYSSYVGDPSLSSLETPGPNVYFWGSYDFMYSRSLSLAQTGKTEYGSGDTRFCSLDAHTFIHESGHMLGLSDYYDYSGQYSPLGGFSMQDMNVGGHDPFSILAFGWTSPYIPQEDVEITLRPFAESGDCVILTPNWNDVDSPFDEYLLLTYYTPTGINSFDASNRYRDYYPMGPSSSGIAVYHVDARLLYGFSENGLSENRMTCDPLTSLGKVYHLTTNTYYNGSNSVRISLLGEDYADYNIVQLIRNSTSLNYAPTDSFDNSDLFMVGETFDMHTFRRQFKNQGLLNDSGTLGWKFTPIKAGNNSITVSLVQE